MKARGGGSIIMISSIAGHTPDPGLGIYSVSKASLSMFTKVLKNGGRTISESCHLSGLIKTKFSQALWQDRKSWIILPSIPIARMGTPDEISRWPCSWLRMRRLQHREFILRRWRYGYLTRPFSISTVRNSFEKNASAGVSYPESR